MRLLSAVIFLMSVAIFANDKPNVIFILTDDLGYGDLGCFGQEKIKTPNLDKMASEGTKFTRHYSGSTVCAPSRCVLLTGKHTGNAWIRGNGELKPNGQRPLRAEEVTIAEQFKKAGYATSVIGKWGLGWLDSEGHPLNQGFDHFFGYLCQRRAHTYYPEYVWRNTEKVELKGNDGKSGPLYTHDLCTDEAFSFIRKNKANPFFLYLAYAIPHTKFQVPDQGQYKDKPWAENHRIQAAMISRMDRDCGRLFELLKELNIDEKTLVIFTSDNGAHGIGGTLEQFKASGDLRGKKRDLYEGGVRVPMIARWPGKIEAGRVNDTISAFWDWMPTFNELIGVETPDEVDGHSILLVLLGEGNQEEHDYLYWEFYEKGGKQAVLKDEWKAIRLNVNKDRKAPLELYNLKNDPSEKNDLAKQYPEKVAEFAKLIDKTHTESDLFKFGLTKKKSRGKKK
ncbi:arylsulfatase [Lentisphaera profundi]|uniref:Arylsulfatase n=1 Tax=Lentisphaera profundi TaxID=1658616 RepID=A0ABY7VY28_9BACT|nr:arylsulfatase [Lentisphaera profundi]WDE98174.1 arylsulfatase [Lentisphaera profundi]